MTLRTISVCTLCACLLWAGVAQANTYAMMEDFESYTPGQSLDQQGWFGGDAVRWEPATPKGTGNPSSTAIGLNGTGYIDSAYKYTGPSPFSNTERVMYSAWLYGNSGVGFAPVHSVNESVPWYYQGPYFSVQWGTVKLRPKISGGTNYTANNLKFQNHWYDIRMIVDPTTGGGSGSAEVWYKDLTEGDTYYKLLSWNNPNTPGADNIRHVPLSMSNSGVHRSTVEDLDTWSVYAGYKNH
ncbi:MAG: hypothetical protein ACOCXX_02760, partial [Planctomycetota bacterium]